MNSIRELKQREKYKNMLKRKNKEINKLKSIIDEVRELLENDYFEDGSFNNYKKVFELLDKENKNESNSI